MIVWTVNMCLVYFAIEGFSFYHGKNPKPNDRFLDWSKFKGFADDKINLF